MPGQTGRSFKMAFAKFGTNSWGVAASVTNGIYFESDGGLQYKAAQITDNAFNQVFTGPGDPGMVEAPTLSLKGRDRYDDKQFILQALAMGSPAPATISTSATGQTTSFQHVFDLADNIDGLGLTFAIDKVLYVEELTSVKVSGFDISQASNGAMDVTYKVVANRPTQISSVNINSTVGGATFPALLNRVLQQQGVFRINLNSGGALASSDQMDAESIKMTFDRPQDSPHVYGSDGIAEPADNDFPVVMLEVKAPRFNSVTGNRFYQAIRSGTAFKADWTFTGAFINSTDQYKELYQFPYLQLDTDGYSAPTDGAHQVKPTLKFAARLAPTSPTGMSFIRPFRLTRIMSAINSVAAF
jgi:hypothetical protein